MRSRVEAILNRYGWKSTGCRVEYRGFEHLLNRDIPDWRSEPIEETAPIPSTRPGIAESRSKRSTGSTSVGLMISPEAAEAIKAKAEMHSKLMAAQKRVDALKEKVKVLKKA